MALTNPSPLQALLAEIKARADRPTKHTRSDLALLLRIVETQNAALKFYAERFCDGDNGETAREALAQCDKLAGDRLDSIHKYDSVHP